MLFRPLCEKGLFPPFIPSPVETLRPPAPIGRKKEEEKKEGGRRKRREEPTQRQEKKEKAISVVEMSHQ